MDPRGADGRSARRHTAGVETRVGAVLVVLVGLGGLYLAWRPSSGTVDDWFLTLIHGTDNGTLSAVTALREPWFVVAGSVVACAVTIRRDLPRALACLLGPPAALAAGELVAKPLVGRTLGGALSYPSGSTVGAAALASVVVLATPAAFRAVSVVVASLYTLWMTVAVIALRWHFPTDAFAGVALGVGVVLLADGLAWRLAEAISASRLSRRARSPGH